MSNFEIKGCDSDQIESKIKQSLQDRNIPLEQAAQKISQCTAEEFLKIYYSRPWVRIKTLLNNLPPWVYSLCKLFPFYNFIRKHTLMTSRKRNFN